MLGIGILAIRLAILQKKWEKVDSQIVALLVGTMITLILLCLVLW